MYNVFLIDDEPWALEDLEACFDENSQFKITGKYTSSKKAWEEIQNTHPHIVFTDIKMPVFTGLDLAKMAKDAGLETEFVIVSGYDDFHYLHDAICIKVFDYCVKPICKPDINTILNRFLETFEKSQRAMFSAQQKIVIEPVSKIFNPQFQEVVSYINENFYKTLTLEDVSKQFFISESYCSQLFVKHFNMSFSKYLTRVKMENAAYILQNSTVSTAKVAELVGYHDYYYFNKVFKKHFGLTPYRYARRDTDEE